MQRYLNLVRVFSSYMVSRISGKAIHWGNPISISIEPTNRCNLHCPECPSGALVLTRKRGNLSLYTFKEIIFRLKNDLFYLTLYFQGEPYINNDLFEMIRYARDNYIFVTTSTNGHYLNQQNAALTVDSGLDEIIISVDGITQESYERYRMGGNLSTVIDGIKELVHQKKLKRSVTPKIIVQFIVFRSNQDQISEIKRLGKEWGANEVKIKTAQFYNFEDGNDMMPDLPRYSRYDKIQGPDGNNRFRIRNHMPNHCWRMWSSAVFTWEGDVVPCCYDKDAEFRMGNINNNSFSNIWRSEKYHQFRQHILKGRKEIGICRNCDQKI